MIDQFKLTNLLTAMLVALDMKGVITNNEFKEILKEVERVHASRNAQKE